MNNPRSMPDGSLWFPRRGDPPPDQPGYTRDPGDAYKFTPIYPSCPHRTEGFYQSPCCPNEGTTFYACNKGFPVTFANCTACISAGRNL